MTNLGPVDAAGVTLTDTLPATVSFVSASPGYTNLGGALAYSIATLSNGLATNFVITVLPLALGTITNAVSISASTADLFPANNAAVNLTSVQFTPIVTGIVLGSTNVAIQFLSIAGQQYALEYKNTLSDPSWTIIPHALTGTGGVLEFDTTNGLPASRFYRIVAH